MSRRSGRRRPRKKMGAYLDELIGRGVKKRTSPSPTIPPVFFRRSCEVQLFPSALLLQDNLAERNTAASQVRTLRLQFSSFVTG